MNDAPATRGPGATGHATTATDERPAARAAAGRAVAEGVSSRTWWIVSAAAFGVGILAYADTLGHGFVWDDTIWLAQKIRFYRGPLDAFFEPAFMPMRQVYRPLSQLTYWLDLTLWRGAPFGFHLTSVLLHALNGALLVRLGRALGLAPGPTLAAAVLFLVHPIQPESVAWITNRVDVLTTTFVLTALLATMRAVSPWSLVLVALASFAAAAAKETGCVTPLLVAAAVVWAPRCTRRREALPVGPAQAAPHARADERGRWLLPLASLLGVVPYLLLRPAVAGTGVPLDALGTAALVPLVGSFGYQVSRLLAPIGFAPYHATVPLDAVTLGFAVLGAVAAAAALLAPEAAGRRRFATAWVLIATALPVVVVLADFTATPVAEHRLYLAVAGLGLLVALGIERYGLTTTRAGRIAVTGALIALGVVTVHRNTYWRDELTLWSAVAARVDAAPLPHMNYGLALVAAGRTAEAEAQYRRALDLDPPAVTRQRTSIDLGLLLVERGDLSEAEELFTRANEIGEHAIADRGLGMVARRRGQAALRAGDLAAAEGELTRALELLNRALAINPRYSQAYLTLAGVQYDAGRYRAAVESYRRAAALSGDAAMAREATRNAESLAQWLAAHPDAP